MVAIRIQDVHETHHMTPGAVAGHARPSNPPRTAAHSFNQDVRVHGAIETPDQAAVLSPDVLRLLSHLHYTLEPRRKALLLERRRRALEIDGGALPHFLEETRAIREDKSWRCAPIPACIQDRRVEITGPVDRKMVINGLNSGAKVYMADFEDSTSPTWANLIQGQVNLRDAVRGSIAYTAPNGKSYCLNGQGLATLFVRPRGLHLDEAHVTVSGAPVAAGLFDLATYLVNNAVPLLAKGAGPFLYIPKTENHLEARWWASALVEIEDFLALPRGTIRATLLIETITAAFEMEEILFEMKDHSLGLNCGRWDYCFSTIKILRAHPQFLTPDRQHLTMTSPFMQAYVKLLIRTCHFRGTYAMGGMAAQIPLKGGGPEAEAALASVREDKLREVKAGHDGTWVAHPGLIKVALAVFDEHMPTPNQIHVVPPEVNVTAEDLLRLPEGSTTLKGLRDNVNVLLQYTRAFLAGVGCIPLHGKMEDAATAEISRVQVYQWLRHGAKAAEDGQVMTPALVATMLREEADALQARARSEEDRRALALARVLVGRMLLEPGRELDDFLTTVCYPYVVRAAGAPARL